MGYVRDSLVAKKLKIRVPKADASKLAQAVLERDFQREQVQQHKVGLELAEQRLVAKELEVEKLQAEVAEQAGLLKEKTELSAQDEKKNLEFAQELEKIKAEMQKVEKNAGKVDAENKGLNIEVKNLTKKLARSVPQTVERFLNSAAFKYAVQVSNISQMRHVVYRELEKLGEAYPFVPEQLGFARVDEKLTLPQSLPGYTWNLKKDRLIDPAGKEVSGKIQLENCKASGIVHYWDKESWPADVFSADVPEGENNPENQEEQV